jgi:hypothetical protein
MKITDYKKIRIVFVIGSLLFLICSGLIFGNLEQKQELKNMIKDPCAVFRENYKVVPLECENEESCNLDNVGTPCKEGSECTSNTCVCGICIGKVE